MGSPRAGRTEKGRTYIEVYSQCNGWDVVRSFNQGKFRREYKFQVGV